MIGLAFGCLLFIVFVFLIAWSAFTVLFVQFCGAVAPYKRHSFFKSSRPPEIIQFHSTFPRGYLRFDVRRNRNASVSVDRYSCVESVVNPLTADLYSAVSFSKHTNTSSTVWSVDVTHSSIALRRFERHTMIFEYNAACINDMSTIVVDS